MLGNGRVKIFKVTAHLDLVHLARALQVVRGVDDDLVDAAQRRTPKLDMDARGARVESVLNQFGDRAQRLRRANDGLDVVLLGLKLNAMGRHQAASGRDANQPLSCRTS